MNKKLHKISFPHTYILLLLLTIFACLLTYIVPAGQFERLTDSVTGQTLVKAGSFSYVKQSPVMFWLIPIKFFETLISTSVSQIIFFIIIFGGALEVIIKAIGLEALSYKIVEIFKKKPQYAIPISITVFSILGFSMGMATEAVVFIPITISAVCALGFDPVIGIAIIFVGTNLGFTAGIYNPFNVGIAQSIAQLPLYSGSYIRWITWICLLIVSCIYTMYYAKKTKANKLDDVNIYLSEKYIKMSKRQISTLFILSISIVIVAFGVASYHWMLKEIAVLFMFSSVLAGIVGGFNPNNICMIFTDGAKKMVGGVFIIGIAATVRTILLDGMILDTFANGVINLAISLPQWARLPGLYISNLVINLLITSGSGQAVIVMPIMLPVADVVGISRQAVVYAFQLGDGITNLVSPLSTTLNCAIAMSGITFQKWFKFYLPLVVINILVGFMLMLFAWFMRY